MLYLYKNFNKIKLPGNLFIQKFCGKLDENIFWFKYIPNVNGFIENEPVTCLFKLTSFFLFLIMETTTDKYLSHKNGLNSGIVVVVFLTPFEKTVIRPELFLPDLFFKKVLKILLILINLIKNILFLNLCVDDVGLCTLIKIFFNKHYYFFKNLYFINYFNTFNFFKISIKTFSKKLFQKNFFKKTFSVENFFKKKFLLFNVDLFKKFLLFDFLKVFIKSLFSIKFFTLFIDLPKNNFL